MRIPSFCFMGLLIAIMTACFLAAASENSSDGLDDATNATPNEPALSNSSLSSISKISAMNESLLNASIPKKVCSQPPFMICGEANVRPAKGTGARVCATSGINASASASGAPQSNRTAFMIKGYTRPTRDSKNGSQSSLTAASLSRGVEGTPHGYVTYYN